MTVYSLEMRRLAEEGCLSILRQAHGWLTGWITDLENTSIVIWTAQPYDSADQVTNLSQWHQLIAARRNQLRTWRDNYQADIDARYGSDYQEALDGAITSFGNLINHMKTLAQTNYWDSTNGEMLVSEVSQTDRNALASDFEDELPTSQVLACAPSFSLSITADLSVS